jgi:flagellar L-ring protein precursor FlgH
VQVDLIIRGACTLRPGSGKVASRLRGKRIVDRYLEHARVLYFSDGFPEGGKPDVYLTCDMVQAGSIWAKRDRTNMNVYSDVTARQIGDVLTIIIAEEHKVDNKVDRTLEKTTDRAVNFDGELNIKTPNHNILPRIPSVDMSATSSNNLEGKADYMDERTIDDRMTVVVEDVQSNGNLVVIGTRQREEADDTQIITVSGIVRPTDIAYDNTVRSEQVANFHIISKTKGYSDTYNKTGWLGSVMDFFWPF